MRARKTWMRSGKSAVAVIVCLLFLMSGISGLALEAPDQGETDGLSYYL